MAQVQSHPASADTVACLYEMSALMRLLHEHAADEYPELNFIWRSVGSSLEQSASCLDELLSEKDQLLSENERLRQQLAACAEN